MLKQSSTASSNKSHKIFVLGLRRVGKTCLLDQLIYGGKASYSLPVVESINGNGAVMDTGSIEDTYTCVVDTGSLDSTGIPGLIPSSSRERVHLFDTPGFPSIQSFLGVDALRNYVTYADAFVLVYSINSRESFSLVELFKRTIDKLRDKRDIPILVLGNKADRFRERQIDSAEASNWAIKEKVRLVEVSATERSTLTEPFLYLVSRLNPAAASVSSAKSSLGSAFSSKLSTKRTTSNMTLEL
jgi:NF-kappa-B inhibitor-interacting Ras-like protein